MNNELNPTVTVVKTKEGSYRVDLSKLTGIFLRINGEDLPSQYNNGVIFTDKVPDIKGIEKTTIIDHYKNISNNDSTVSVDDYEKQRQELLIHRVGDEEDGKWDSLESEYTYKKFTRDHVAINRIIYNVLCDYDIVVVDEVISEYDCIIPYTHIGKNKVNYFSYKANCFKLCADVAKELGFEWVKGSIYSIIDVHGKKWSLDKDALKLDYLKINDEYCFGTSKGSIYGCEGTYDECVKKYKEHYDLVYSKFKEQAVKLSDKIQISNKLLLDNIDAIIHRIGYVDSKQKTMGDYNCTLKYLKEFKELIINGE